MIEENTIEKDDVINTHKLTLIIEDKEYHWTDQYITGLQIKELGNISADSEIYLSIKEPWKDEEVKDNDQIDLARPGIEYFYIKRKLKLTIDGKEFDWGKQFIRGSEIRKLGDILPDFSIFLSIKGPWDDELIQDEDKIDLARPGIEHFYSKDTRVKVTIKINNIAHNIYPGEYRVTQLKKIGGIQPSYELTQLINGTLSPPLDDNAIIIILGGEEFFSNPREGGSSW